MDRIFVIVNTAAYRLITVQGDIDETSVDDFRLACTSERPIIVDLLRCSYIDSSGLSVLIVRNRSGNVALVLRADCRIYRIFEITGLLQYFHVATAPLEAASLLALSPNAGPPFPDPTY